MWFALLNLAFAADPSGASPSGGSATAQAPADQRGAIEAGLALALPLPTAGLGPGPGLRVIGEYAVFPRLTVGAEVSARIPTGAADTLDHPSLAEDLDWTAGLTVIGGGARVAYHIGPRDGVRMRAALAGGVAWVALDTVTQVGRTHDAVLTGWVQPEVGALVPVGPGAVTVDLLVPIAPADLLVLGNAPGGTGISLAAGYRFALGKSGGKAGGGDTAGAGGKAKKAPAPG